MRFSNSFFSIFGVFSLIIGVHAPQPVHASASITTLAGLIAAGKKAKQLYDEGKHCKVLCSSYTCGRGAVKSSESATRTAIGAFGALVTNPQLRTGVDASVAEKSFGSMCKSLCQTKEEFTVLGDKWEIKKRFGPDWNIEGCVRAYNAEIDNKVGSRGAQLSSIAVYNQEDYEKVKKAFESEVPDLQPVAELFERTTDVQ